MGTLYGGIEAGGTKFVCAVGSNPDDLRDEIRYKTTTPEETIGRAIKYFQEQNNKEPLAAIGLGAFGPVDLHAESPTYGFITSTPKPGWADTDLLGIIKRALNIPVGLDTDVNAAAFGEYCWGAAEGLNDFIYLTIGTGIGSGGMIDGSLIHGMVHPEMGHIFIPHDMAADPYKGICPFHGDCFEGLATGPALKDRWGMPADEFGPDHEAWNLEAYYIALALVNYICILSPQRIILGGGVMQQLHIFPMIRQKVQQLLNGYIKADEISKNIDQYIVPPKLGNLAGILGAIALAEKVANEST